MRGSLGGSVRFAARIGDTRDDYATAGVCFRRFHRARTPGNGWTREDDVSNAREGDEERGCVGEVETLEAGGVMSIPG